MTFSLVEFQEGTGIGFGKEMVLCEGGEGQT